MALPLVFPRFVFVTGFILASVLGVPACPEDFFYDHGTNRCEHCHDICNMAQRQKTMEACAQRCPAYARKSVPVNVLPDGSDVEGSSASHLSSAAKIAIGCLAAVAFVAAFSLAIVKRKSILNMLRRRPPEAEVREEAEEVRQPLHMGAGVLEGGHPLQETLDGRRGNFEMAVLGGSNRSSLAEEVEPKTFQESAGAPAAMTTTTV